MSRTWTCLLLTAALGALPCAAQTALEPPELGDYLRWGAFRVRPGFVLSELGYDNNIFRTAVDPVGDYTGTLSPRVEALVLFGDRAFLTYRGVLGYRAYVNHSEQNFANLRNASRLTFPFRRTGLFIQGQLNHLEQRPIDIEQIRTDQNQDGLGAGVIFSLGWRTELELSRSRLRRRYDDDVPGPAPIEPISERLDRTALTDLLQLDYLLLGRTRLTLEVSHDTIEFASPTSRGQDTVGWTTLPGVDFGTGGRLSGTLQAGWADFDTRDPSIDDFSGVVGRAKVAYRPNPDTTLKFEGASEPGYSTTSTSLYFVNTDASIQGVYYLNRLIGVELLAGLGRLTFESSDRVDDLRRYEAGLRFRLGENTLGRRVEYSLKLKHSERETTVPNQNRNDTTIGFGAVLGY